ncbi:MAG TPA: arsenite methyltransferase [Friedmanniella sp.]
MSDIRDQVREHYALAVTEAVRGAGGCCGGSAECSTFYDEAEIAELPVEARAASMGSGNPTAIAELTPGERVVDLGSGGGIDVLLAARLVGPTGFAYGVDMTDEMLAVARANAERAGATNVDFRKGVIEALPLPDASVDVVISNCVINLSPDKPAVLAEAFRVLAPGGRVRVADVVADEPLTPERRAALGEYASCAGGALARSEYLAELERAGFVDAEVTFVQHRANGVHPAVVRARKPAEEA